MGWNYFFWPLAKVISNLLQGYSTANVDVKIIAHSSLVNGVVWTVNEITARENAPLWHLEAGQSRLVIYCNVVARHKGLWGFRRIEENSALMHHSCPLHYLKMAPAVSSEWRSKVHQYHQTNADLSFLTSVETQAA